MNHLRSLSKESFQLTIDHLHTFNVAHKPKYTVKALLSPRGAYLMFEVLDGGLNREGAYWRGGPISKIKIKDANMIFIFLYFSDLYLKTKMYSKTVAEV